MLESLVHSYLEVPAAETCIHSGSTDPLRSGFLCVTCCFAVGPTLVQNLFKSTVTCWNVSIASSIWSIKLPWVTVLIRDNKRLLIQGIDPMHIAPY